MEPPSPAPDTPPPSTNRADSARISFVERTCLHFLQDNQNQDGGWAFQPGRQSRVEPTAWASLALQDFAPSTSQQNSLSRGLKFLADAQLENGGWAAVSGDREGCWVTSLACWALGRREEYATNVSRGLQWLNDDLPADSGFLWRTARALFGRSRINAQSPYLSGWSWTPHTASWVEPTSYAMIVEQRQASAASDLANPPLNRRYKIAEQMLYDRMCPGGGWNCGNPRVYGVAGQPRVGPSAWALVALRGNSQRSENQESLKWLLSAQDTIKSPESLALAHIALGIYGKSNPALTDSLYKAYNSATQPWSVQAVAWTTLAFNETLQWLNATSRGNS